MRFFDGERALLAEVELRGIEGVVAATRGLAVLVERLPVAIGALVRIEARSAAAARPPACVRGEVVGFDGERTIVMLLGHAVGLSPGMRVIAEQSAATVRVGDGLLGRVIDGFGRPIDSGPPVPGGCSRPLHARPAPPLDRAGPCEKFVTGVRAIDGLLTVAHGQRVGIFSAAGVGKSTLLASIARNSEAEVNIIALIGERGREARDFIDRSLDEHARQRSVIVVAAGDESPVLCVRAARVACAVAEHFRDQGARVALFMDSLTRVAQAQRQIGLASGEAPATRGYPPSVFALITAILERAGAFSDGGSITAFYSALHEADEADDPLCEAVRSGLDGHIALSRTLAGRGHYPAIDVVRSVSRLAESALAAEERSARRRLLALLSAHEESKELLQIGAYAPGSNPDCDAALALRPALLEFLCQDAGEKSPADVTWRQLRGLAADATRAQSPGTTAAGIRADARLVMNGARI